MATDSHRIEPLVVKGDAGAGFARLRTVLGNRKDTRIIEPDDSHIRVEFRTFLGFVDEGLLLLDPRMVRFRFVRLSDWVIGTWGKTVGAWEKSGTSTQNSR